MDPVLLGVIDSAHGLRGLVRVRSFTAVPEAIAHYGPLTDDSGTTRWRLTVVGRARGAVLAAIDGIDDRTAAETLKGQRLYLERHLLPELEEPESFYHADLIGLRARTDSGIELGPVRGVHDFGAGDILEIALAEDETALIPFTLEATPKVDIGAGVVVVTDAALAAAMAETPS